MHSQATPTVDPSLCTDLIQLQNSLLISCHFRAYRKGHLRLLVQLNTKASFPSFEDGLFSVLNLWSHLQLLNLHCVYQGSLTSLQPWIYMTDRCIYQKFPLSLEVGSLNSNKICYIHQRMSVNIPCCQCNSPSTYIVHEYSMSSHVLIRSET